MPDRIVAKSPGKIILAGEHAVVYGAPAMACAIDQYVEVTCEHHLSAACEIHLPNHTYQLSREQCDSHDQFTSSADIRLIDHVIKSFYQHTHLFPTVKLSIHSDLAIGCGFGSSAALILALLKALFAFFELDQNALYELAIASESFQHGKSSGIDIHTCYHGGCWIFDEGKGTSLQLPTSLPFYYYNSGSPNQSTSDCVKHAAFFLAPSAQKQPDQHHNACNLIRQSTENTHRLIHAISTENHDQIHQCIHNNHLWLAHIGVVPSTIQTQIEQWYQQGIAAKIAGAGALSGQSAGCILIFGDAQDHVFDHLSPLSIDSRGCHVTH